MNSILAAVDFSDASASTVAHGARLASAEGGLLHLLPVIDVERLDELVSAAPFPRAELAEQLVSDAREELAAAAAVAGVKFELHVEIGNPSEVIIEAAARLSSDLLVIGARGRTGRVSGVGSVAMKCVRRAPVDVVVVRAAHDHGFRTIMACLDFSAISSSIVEAAVRFAAKDGSRLVLLHAHSNPFDYFRFSLVPDTTEPYEAYVKVLLQRLKSFGSNVPDSVPFQCRLACGPNYGQSIIETADSIGVDLIVVGTVGRSNLRYALLGSTAERVLRATPCSVLAIKPGQSRA